MLVALCFDPSDSKDYSTSRSLFQVVLEQDDDSVECCHECSDVCFRLFWNRISILLSVAINVLMFFVSGCSGTG